MEAGRPERAHPRRKVFQPAALRVGAAPVKAHVLDISLGGARLHCAARCAPGAAVEVSACAVTVRGRIMWRVGDRLGIRFDRLLGDGEIDSLFG